MRKIRFRAWNIKSGYFAPIEDDSDFMMGFGSDGSIYMINNGDPEPDKWVFQQYTGLKDKNGREIYEGDVVTTDYTRGRSNTIVRRLQVISLDGCYQGISLTDSTDGDCLAAWPNKEIIGNIHEHPELLEIGK